MMPLPRISGCPGSLRVHRLRCAFVIALLLPACSSLSAVIPGLFNTGVGNNGATLATGVIDPHYRLVQSADPALPGPDARVVDDALFPIVGTGPWLPTTTVSKWIAPQANQSTGNQLGDYRYRISFDLAGLDPATALITGRWSSDNIGVDILLNGMPTGNANSAQFAGWSAFTISASSGDAFLEGSNTIDFIVNNAPPGANPTGFRAEFTSATAEPFPPPGTPPSILSPPQSRTTTLGDTVSFSVIATGARPLSYQWRFNDNNISNATNSAYQISGVANNHAGNYRVVVTNPWGSVTSAPAQLKIIVRLGPSSRRTGVVISEIMYHPKARADGRNLEFIELHNSNPFEEDLSGYRISGDWDYTFPDNTFIPGDGYLVIAAVPGDVQSVYGIADVLGGLTNSLPNDAGTVRLRKRSGAIVLEVDYSDDPPWPVAADGTGHSLVLARPWLGENNPQAWSHSGVIGGLPGVSDLAAASDLENVVINEILAHTDEPNPDFVELHNHGTRTVDVSGCYLTDDAATTKYRIADGTTLGPGGFIAFDQTELGFAFSADGEEVFLVNPAQTRVIDAVRYTGQARQISHGRFPDGARGFQELTSPTRGTTNAALSIRNVVINEIMYNSISGGGDDEYIELHNRGALSANVGGWRFSEGIDFAIPNGTTIPAGGFLVIAKNASRLLTNYPGLSPAQVVGDFTGRLDDGGETITLAMPELRLVTNVVVTTNVHYVVVDEVTYSDGGRWGKWADGGGSSLELIDPHSDNRLPSNWANSDESSKAPWTLVEHTGAFDNGSGTADRLDVFLQGAGEALLDNVEVLPPGGGANLVLNPTFEAGTPNWILQGTHVRSTNQLNEGYNSARSLHLVASERGDHVANHARAILSSAVTASSTIRARVRWLRGHPEILLRTKGGYIEAVGRLNVPAALGTPGAPNSQYRTNAGPAISEVKHSPLLPQAAQPIRVTARLHDPDGVQTVTISYRVDPSATRFATAMADNGLNGDEVAGDGMFTGTIPGQSANALVAFYVQALDGAASPVQARFPDTVPARECLVRVGETQPGGAFGAYRLWMTQAAIGAWSNRPIMSNEDIDATFVYGNNNVVYSAGAHFSGSSYTAGCYTTPTGNISGYDINLPDDEALLGETHFTLDFLVRDGTGQREQTQYWLLEQFGLPNMYRRYVHVIVNGVPQTARSGCLGSNAIYEDVQQPSGTTIEEWFSDDTEGDLYKTDCWDEFSDLGVRETGCIALNRLENYPTTGGVKDVARYRWNWRPRAIDGTANDFASLFELVDAANATGPGYQSAVECIVDVPHWAKTFAMNDLSSFWDAFGNPNGKNTYLYKPERSGWKLMCWDFDVGLGTGHADPTDRVLFESNDPIVSRMIPQNHTWTRLYWCALQEAMDTFFRIGPGTALNRMLEAKYNAFRESAVGLESPDVIKTWINGRRTFLQTQLNTVAAAFTVSGPTSITTSTNLLNIFGTAPVTVHTILVNGVPYPIIWTSVTTWRMTVPVSATTTILDIQGLDRSGNPVAGATAQLNVTYTGEDARPEDHIVINEIMYNPVISESAFVELFNTSSNYTFDISGWRINGLDFTFPAGTIISNRQFLVVAKNRGAFGAAYGWNIPVRCEFDGQLDNGGETLTLIKPGATPEQDVVVDRVTYDDDPPWPSSADGGGYSLQLIDPAQDNNRVSNWTDGQGWRFHSFTTNVGSVASSRMSFFITNTTGGDIYLDDLSFVRGSTPGVGTNYFLNGGFESLSAAPFVLGPQASNSTVVTGIARSGNASLHFVQNPGTIQLTTFYQDVTPVMTQTVYTLSFWFLSGQQGTGFRSRMNAFVDNTANIRSLSGTPGAPNAIITPLPPYPSLWLSEVDPSAGPAVDNANEPEPWIELHYAGGAPFSLDGYFLSDNFSNLTQWAFPSTAAIQPQQYLLVWVDGEPGESTPQDAHASFRLSAMTGSVVLSRLVNGTPQIVDYLNYSGLATNQSYGAHPQSSLRQPFDYPTPRGVNDPTPAPVRVFINEWMAGNSLAVRDPADGDFNDWFELYNASASPVDLSGYKLTDLLANSNKFTIPDGFVIPAGGFLLVWADEEEGQSRTNGDLHVGFRLSVGGEQIGLFEPRGRLVDAVVFDGQTNDISQGRFPDGAAAPYHFMTGFTPGAPNRLDPPQIQILEIIVSPSTATLTWASQPGRTYRVQHSADLIQWLDLSPDAAATAQSTSITDNTMAGATQRFYRVSLVQ
jgi:hypothetical protein